MLRSHVTLKSICKGGFGLSNLCFFEFEIGANHGLGSLLNKMSNIYHKVTKNKGDQREIFFNC